MTRTNAALAALRCGTWSLLLLLHGGTAEPVHVAAQWGINPTILHNNQRLRPSRPAHPTHFHIQGFKNKVEAQHFWHNPKPPGGLAKKGEESAEDEDSGESNEAWGPAPGPAPAPMTAEQAEQHARRNYQEKKDDLEEARMRRLDKQAAHGLAESKYLHAKARYTVARAEEDEDAMEFADKHRQRLEKAAEKAKKEHREARVAHRQARLEHHEAKKHLEKHVPDYFTREKEEEEDEKEEKEEKEAQEEEEDKEKKKEQEDTEKKNPFEEGRPNKKLMWAAPCFAIILVIFVYTVSGERPWWWCC